MLTTDQAYRLFVDPALDLLASLGGPPRDPKADRQLLATMVQETEIRYRLQISGPARSFYQFERIAILDVMTRQRTEPVAELVCAVLGFQFNADVVFDKVAYNDVLATCFARLNYRNSRVPLPSTQEEGWTAYNSAWKPGKPRPAHWAASWAAACKTIPLT